MRLQASSFGPIIGPIISGCSVKYGWRWTFRIDVILSGTTWLLLIFLSGKSVIQPLFDSMY